MKIGVFDSGIGGLSVVRAIEQALPEHQIIFCNDSQNIPYGTKNKEILHTLVLPILQTMVDEGCRVIVIACNTVTTTLINRLRTEIIVPLIGMEPMVKTASKHTKTKKIAVFATPTTLASRRYHELKANYAKDIMVFEPDCSDWSAMIEKNSVDRSKIIRITDEVCKKGADTIVLGCTHYHWIEDLIKHATNDRAEVLQPEQPVIVQLQRVMQDLGH